MAAKLMNNSLLSFVELVLVIKRAMNQHMINHVEIVWREGFEAMESGNEVFQKLAIIKEM